MNEGGFFTNPFYEDPNDKIDDTNGMSRPSPLMLTSLAPDLERGSGITTGGTIAPSSMNKDKKSKKQLKGQVADCFDEKTVAVHANKGGDGFEAWKGNRKVIKKLKLGVKKVELKHVPREHQYSQPFNHGFGGH